MSGYIVGKVLWTSLPAHLKLTAVVIADASNDTGYSFPGIDRIAAQIGQGKRQAMYNIAELQRRGILTVTPRGKPGGGRSSNAYQLNLDALGTPPPAGAKVQPIAPLNMQSDAPLGGGKDATDCTFEGGQRCNPTYSKGAIQRRKTLASSCSAKDSENDPSVEPSDITPPTPQGGARVNGSRFGEFWDAWPETRKRDRKKAEATWKRRNLDTMADRIIADVQARKAQDDQWIRGYVPMPTTYLNGDRWEDTLSAPIPQPRSSAAINMKPIEVRGGWK